MWMAVSLNKLIGALIAVTGAMLILGVSSFVAKHASKYVDGVLRARKDRAADDTGDGKEPGAATSTETQAAATDEDAKLPPIG